MKPALTAEEWERMELRPERDFAFEVVSEYAEAATDFAAKREVTRLLVNPNHPNILYQRELNPQQQHALAALALYGQHFGFTRKDVALLRGSSVHLTSCGSFDEFNPSTAECDCSGNARASDLADRLEVLLPPEFAPAPPTEDQ